MKTVLDKQTRNELIARMGRLNENSKSQWGKMTVYQMLKHCTLCEEMYLGKTMYKRAFIGYLFGRIALRKMLKDESPMQRNAPTNPVFKVADPNGDVHTEKDRWIALTNEYGNYKNDSFVHWFFGPMSNEQVGYFVYKHTDHHLRQFNV